MTPLGFWEQPQQIMLQDLGRLWATPQQGLWNYDEDAQRYLYEPDTLFNISPDRVKIAATTWRLLNQGVPI